MVDVFCKTACDKTTLYLIHHHGSGMQDMFVFDNCSHFFSISEWWFSHAQIWTLPSISDGGFIIKLSTPTTLEFIYMRRPWLTCWRMTSFLRKSILAFLLRSFCCFSFDNWNLLSLLSTVARLTHVVIFGIIGFQDEQQVYIFVCYLTIVKL